jgi:hypothetical protein
MVIEKRGHLGERKAWLCSKATLRGGLLSKFAAGSQPSLQAGRAEFQMKAFVSETLDKVVKFNR